MTSLQSSVTVCFRLSWNQWWPSNLFRFPPPSGVENLINDDHFFFVDRSCLSFELSKIGISSVAAALHMHTALAWLVWSVLISRKLKKKQGSRVAATSRLSERQLQHRKDDLKGQFIFFCVLYTFYFNGVINCHLPPYPYPMLKYSIALLFHKLKYSISWLSQNI